MRIYERTLLALSIIISVLSFHLQSMMRWSDLECTAGS
jgi:hypothetical protein